MEFIQTPNLPEADVALVAMSGTYRKIISALDVLGIQVIEIKPCQSLSKPVSSHADMLMHHLGGDQIVVANGEEYLSTQLNQYGFTVTLSNKCILDYYPNDVALNAARVGSKQIANVAALDKTIIQHCEKNQIQLISAKQGYAKCSVVVINEQSIITADQSIAEAAGAAGIDVLRITPGYVDLDGYDYGFLGGACGMIGKNVLAFTGRIQEHPDYGKIKSYCNNRRVDLISLTDSALMDIGGIIPLKAKVGT
jgi:hypothetical protein